MNKRLEEALENAAYDGLLVNNCPPANVCSVTIRKLTTQRILARGTTLARSDGEAGDGKMVVLGSVASSNETLSANCILADSISVGDTDDVVALAYRTGHFNRGALIVEKQCFGISIHSGNTCLFFLVCSRQRKITSSGFVTVSFVMCTSARGSG